MSIRNALASLAVQHLDTSARWYEQLLGKPGQRPMPELAEWRFERGGGLQVYELPQRAGSCSCTLSVDDLDAEVTRLAALGLDVTRRTESDRVRTLMVADPDGNSIALAETSDPSLLR